MLIKLTNDFHNTSATVRILGFERHLSGVLSRRQVARVRRVLCPVTGCNCGETMLKTRGAQRIEHPHYEPDQGILVDLEIYESGSGKGMYEAVIEIV